MPDSHLRDWPDRQPFRNVLKCLSMALPHESVERQLPEPASLKNRLPGSLLPRRTTCTPRLAIQRNAQMKIPMKPRLYRALGSGAVRRGRPKSAVSVRLPDVGRVLGVLRCVGIFLYLISLTGLLVSPAHGQASSPIAVENQQAGTSQWQIPFGSAATDSGGQIKGYASATSVNKGENISFYVSVNPAQTYTIDVYRMGWYQGLGGRLMQHIGPLSGVQQPTCPTDGTTGMIECQWAPAYTLATQTSWTSGIYLALMINAQGYQNYIVFVVRDDSRVAALLYQQPVTTYQAYNDYPFDNTTGKSLYSFNSYGATTVSGGPNAVKVSFDRPYMSDGTGIAWGQSFFSWEFAFVRWMEKSGYDVTYATDVDTHTNGSMLLNYRGILSGGHDEYWSKPMYDAFIAALAGAARVFQQRCPEPCAGLLQECHS